MSWGDRVRRFRHASLVTARVTVLGSCGAWPEAGRACNGFLVEHLGYTVAMDLGNGTLPNLLATLGSDVAEGLDAVVITHSHPDHMVDAHALMRARLYGQEGLPKLRLVAPRSVLARLASLEEDDEEAVTAVFQYEEPVGQSINLGPFTVTTTRLPHYVENVGVRLDGQAVAIAYTGDTGPNESITELGRDVDLFIVDATDRHQQPNRPKDGDPELLLTAALAAQAARAAHSRRLMLTHFWPGNDRQRARREAAEYFDGEVIVADEGLVVQL